MNEDGKVCEFSNVELELELVDDVSLFPLEFELLSSSFLPIVNEQTESFPLRHWQYLPRIVWVYEVKTE